MTSLRDFSRQDWRDDLAARRANFCERRVLVLAFVAAVFWISVFGAAGAL